MKIKVCEAEGPVLDWMVAKCEFGDHLESGDWDGTLGGIDTVSDMQGGSYAPSTDWAQGGPIIEREEISVVRSGQDCWWASKRNIWIGRGATILVAAMRGYVYDKLGDEVEVEVAVIHKKIQQHISTERNQS